MANIYAGRLHRGGGSVARVHGRVSLGQAMTRDERIESVRRAMLPSFNKHLNEQLSPKRRNEIMDEAVRAAILATLQSLLDPSEGMLDASIDAGGYSSARWRAMIQQAIKEME